MIFRPVTVIMGHTEFTHLKAEEFCHPKKKVSREFRVLGKVGPLSVAGGIGPICSKFDTKSKYPCFISIKDLNGITHAFSHTKI